MLGKLYPSRMLESNMLKEVKIKKFTCLENEMTCEGSCTMLLCPSFVVYDL